MPTPIPRRTSDVDESDFGVTLRREPRRPVTASDLGITLQRSHAKAAYSRRLVTLEDSLTQGFHHLAVRDTDMSWPAIAARTVDPDGNLPFAYPSFAATGGYPSNLEFILRLDDGAFLPTVTRVLRYLTEVKRAWAPTDAATLPPRDTPPYDNLAVWGWALRDLLERTGQTECAAVARHDDGWSLIPTVDHAMNRTGATVLTEWRPVAASPHLPTMVRDATALDLARHRGDTGDGIETLAVWIGNNNALKSLGSLEVVPSGPGFDTLNGKEPFTVWTPHDFEIELRRVEAEVRTVRADHVLWATVPHVTIAPLVRGLGDRLRDNPRYFQYYGRPWQTDEEFDPAHEPHLTGRTAWLIDTVIDRYNDTIEQMVRRARTQGLDWRLVDLCAGLDRLAVRRNDEDGADRPDFLTPYPLPPGYEGLDTRFLGVDATGRITSGGLIGLDGVHPTTAGYGLIAHEFLRVMRAAGVALPDNRAAPDWADILARDTLLRDPPVRLDGVLALIDSLHHHLDVLQHPFGRREMNVRQGTS